MHPDLRYVRYGVGADIAVRDFLQLALQFEANTLLNHNASTHNYNILSVGLRSNGWLRLGKQER